MAGFYLHMPLLILVLFVGPCLAQDRTDTEPKDQYGDMHCVLRNGVIEATFLIVKNNSQITRAYFTNSSTYLPYTGSDCTFSGAGTVGDPFTATVFIDPNTDDPPAGKDYCGHIPIISGDTYQWQVYTQRLENFHMDGNVLFTFQCNTLPSNISVTLENLGREVIELPSTIGSLELSMVRTNAVTAQTVITINIGEMYYPRLRFQPSSDTSGVVDIDLYPWGAYCERFFVTPADNSGRSRELFDTNGCPNPNIGFAGNGFIGQRPPSGQIFYAFAGPLEAWRFDKSPDFPTGASDNLNFFCYAKLCWRPDDQKCLQKCPNNKRKRRFTEDDLDDTYLVSYTVTLTEPEDTTSTDKPTRFETTTAAKATGSSEMNLLTYIVSGVGGFIVLVLLLTTVCYCCYRQSKFKERDYRRRVENSSISSSAVILDDDMQRKGGPRFGYPGKF